MLVSSLPSRTIPVTDTALVLAVQNIEATGVIDDQSREDFEALKGGLSNMSQGTSIQVFAYADLAHALSSVERRA